VLGLLVSTPRGRAWGAHMAWQAMAGSTGRQWQQGGRAGRRAHSAAALADAGRRVGTQLQQAMAARAPGCQLSSRLPAVELSSRLPAVELSSGAREMGMPPVLYKAVQWC